MPISTANMTTINYQNRKKNIFRPYFKALYVIALTLAFMPLAGCSLTKPFTEPAPQYLKVTIDHGPPEYRAGYEDGCKTALSAYGNTYMKTIYSIRKRPEYQYNNMYNQIWRDAWNYCYMSYFIFIRKDILYGDMML